MNLLQQSNLFHHGFLAKSRYARNSALLESMFHLSHLLHAGCTVSAALDDVIDMEGGYIRKRVWADVKHQVDRGLALSSAMASWPRYFPVSCRGLILAGEATGELAMACQTCLDDLKWQEDLRNRMASALTYPMLALMVLLSVLCFLLVSVVPSLHGFLASGQETIAWHTHILMVLSEWMQSSYRAMLITILLLVAGVGLSRLVLPFTRVIYDRLLLRLPLIGPVLINLSLSQYASSCAHLYRSGLKLADALEISEKQLANRVLRHQLSLARARMVAGSGFGLALQTCSCLPNTFKRLITIGEAAGALEEALLHVSMQQKKRAEFRLQRLEHLAGPIVLLLVGGCLLWLVVSLIGPVYSSAISSVLSS